MPRRRAAVVIGVNRTGGAGAGDVADWLRAEGFEVTAVTDAAGKVTWQEIRDAIAAFVNPGNCDQLVVYFSGHGLWKNDTELWLLSDAPEDANAAVSWAETAELAKNCGVPNVVLISDACRAIPVTPLQMRVRGALVFPNEERPRAKVDKFIAAADGQSAYEIPLDGKIVSAFTHCFLRAFDKPDPDMIRKVTEDGQTIDVVPNRRLGKYLRREVSALLASVGIKLDQTPDAEVLSDDDIYIGRVRLTAPLKAPASESTQAAPVIHDVAAMAISRAIDVPPPFTDPELAAVEDLARTSGFNDALDQARASAEMTYRDPFRLETGFTIVGTTIDDVAPANGASAYIRTAGNHRHGDPGAVHVWLRAPVRSVALRFGNGRGTVLAAIRGYTGHVRVDGNSIVNVNYVPSTFSWRWPAYLQNRGRVETLRATAAAAARYGVFRLDDRQKAADVDAVIRLPAFDPALCLYAAYAYADAGFRDNIGFIHAAMEKGIGARLLDVAMLVRRLTPTSWQRLQQQQALPVAPFCPMLTQGWNLLRVRGIKLPPVLEDAQDELEPALWTTFKPARMQMIFDAIKQGELT
jgi:hypothetical protein